MPAPPALVQRLAECAERGHGELDEVAVRAPRLHEVVVEGGLIVVVVRAVGGVQRRMHHRRRRAAGWAGRRRERQRIGVAMRAAKRAGPVGALIARFGRRQLRSKDLFEELMELGEPFGVIILLGAEDGQLSRRGVPRQEPQHLVVGAGTADSVLGEYFPPRCVGRGGRCPQVRVRQHEDAVLIDMVGTGGGGCRRREA